MIRDIEHIRAYSDPGHACNQGSIIALANGDLLLGYNEERGRVHSDSGQSCLVGSKDGGRTWDPSSRVVVWPYTDFGGNWDCAFTQLSSGEILMHTRVCSFIAPAGLNVENIGEQVIGPPPGRRERLKRQTGYALCRSSDNGRTWSTPTPVNTAPISDSGLGPYVVGGSGAGHAFCLRSDDGGANWEYWSTIAFDAAAILLFAEVGWCRMASGRIVCLLRAQARPGRFDNMWSVYSDDDGASWSRPARTSLWGYPADLTQLPDGRVLAVYGYRRPPWGVRGCVSEDGITWDPANEFTIREGGAADPAKVREYWHIGYPSVAQWADGTLIAAYHEYSADEAPIQEMWVTRFRVD
jgi:hypothetical protein